LGEIPFETVYLHARVLDKDGEKMSKSKPETMIDPLDVCQKYGTDAVRLSLLMGVAPGADVRLSEDKIAGFRNFTNKLWNIARFMSGKIQEIPRTGSRLHSGTNNKIQSDLKMPKAKTLADKWILGRLSEVTEQVTDNIEKFQFSQAGETLRDFTWNELADWYLEMAKIESAPAKAMADKSGKSEILNYILNTILKLWHPFMPFVTEQIWSEIYGAEKMLMVERWPVCHSERSEESLTQFNLIKNIITNIRSLRSDYKIEPAKKLRGIISAGKNQTVLEENSEVIKVLARLEDLEIRKKVVKPKTAVSFIEGNVEVYVNLAGVIDFSKEKQRLEKEIKELTKYVSGLDKKLENKKFTESAPEEVVSKEKNKLEEFKKKLTKLKSQLNNLN